MVKINRKEADVRAMATSVGHHGPFILFLDYLC